MEKVILIFINIGPQKPNGDFKDSCSVDLMMPMRKGPEVT